MTIPLLAGIGAVACLVLLAVLAVISQVSAKETPEFVYLVGFALAIAAWLMLSKAGL